MLIFNVEIKLTTNYNRNGEIVKENVIYSQTWKIKKFFFFFITGLENIGY